MKLPEKAINMKQNLPGVTKEGEMRKKQWKDNIAKL